LGNKLVKYNPIYTYPSLRRKQTDRGRLYETEGVDPVPSVTTILDKTKPQEAKQALQEWRNRVGHAKAQEISTEAAGRGTSMHKQLENWLEHGELKTGGNMVHQQAAKMAQLVIDEYLEPHLQEWWASEANLYHTGLYAGTTDLVGIYDGKPSIIDFKQTNKPKKTEWITDYFLQGAAYSQAHNHLFGTDVAQIVVLMCSKDLELQRWIVNRDEFDHWTEQWWLRVSEYYMAN
jgi:ATP-dependent exoDNAse (exonuclease V) beta subunit